MKCNCLEIATKMAQESESEYLRDRERRIDDARSFRERQRTDVRAEAIAHLAKSYALLRGVPRNEELNDFFLRRLDKESKELQSFIRIYMDKIKEQAGTPETHLFAADFKEPGLKLGRSTIEIELAKKIFGRLNAHFRDFEVVPLTCNDVMVRFVVEAHERE